MRLSEERLKEVTFLCVSILPNIITILITGLLQLPVVYINVLYFSSFSSSCSASRI